MKSTDKKKKQLSLKRVISNNIFLLKMAQKASPARITIELLLTALSAVFNFISDAYLLRHIVNSVQKGTSFKDLVTFILIFSGLKIINNMLYICFYNIFHPVFYNDTNAYIQKIIYNKATEVELSCYENPEFYNKYVKAIDESAERVGNVIGSISSVIYSIITVFANGFLIFVVEPKLIFLALLPLLLSMLEKKRNEIEYDRDMKIKEMNRCKNYTQRVFYLSDYAKEMRLTEIHRVMFQRFKTSSENILEILRKYKLSIIGLNYIIEEAREILTFLGATLYSVYHTLVTGRMLYGDCLVIINSLQTLTYMLQYNTHELLAFHEHALYIENLREFLEYQPKIINSDESVPVSPGDIELNDVSFKYEGSSHMSLKDLKIQIGANKKIAIVGHNGAGKSTLVKLLLRLYDPIEGSITLGGMDIKNYRLDEYRDQFGVVLQDYKNFSLSVAENILLRKRTPEDDILLEDVLKKSGAYDRVKAMEHGLDTILTREFDDKGEVLSGGEAQKLAVAHIFTKQNLCVILDEPSSALDPIAEYNMYNNMMKACEDCAMVFISHRLSSAVMADYIYLLNNGEVVETGTHSELMKLHGKYADMFEKQAQNYVDKEECIYD